MRYPMWLKIVRSRPHHAPLRGRRSGVQDRTGILLGVPDPATGRFGLPRDKSSGTSVPRPGSGTCSTPPISTSGSPATVPLRSAHPGSGRSCPAGGPRGAPHRCPVVLEPWCASSGGGTPRQHMDCPVQAAGVTILHLQSAALPHYAADSNADLPRCHARGDDCKRILESPLPGA